MTSAQRALSRTIALNQKLIVGRSDQKSGQDHPLGPDRPLTCRQPGSRHLVNAVGGIRRPLTAPQAPLSGRLCDFWEAAPAQLRGGSPSHCFLKPTCRGEELAFDFFEFGTDFVIVVGAFGHIVETLNQLLERQRDGPECAAVNGH